MKLLYYCFIVFSTFLAADKVTASVDDSLDITSATFSHWLNTAYIAQAMYQPKNDLLHVLESQGYTIDQYKQLDGYLVTYVLATNDKTKHQLLAVRGTSNVENIIVNSAFILVPDKITGIDIHQGFLLSAKDIYQQIIPDIKPDYKIKTIGHSLGGAAALIIAMMLDAHTYPVDEVITFGQPKVTNISGSKKFSHLNITRLVMPKDIVPLVPPIDPMDMMQLSIFWHQGTEVILMQNNQYAVTSGVNSMMRALDFLNDVPGQQHINNHFMSSYIKNLKLKQKSSLQVPYKNDFRLKDWFGSSTTTSR